MVVVRSGDAVTGVLSAPALLTVGSGPCVPSSAIDEVTLRIFGTPTPQGLTGRTANVRAPVPLAASDGGFRVQTDPAVAPFAQLQPAEEPAVSKVELAGTVAVR